MRDGATKSFEQAYNAQIAVDGEAQIIVAADITQEANDKEQLVPLLEQVKENLGQLPEKVSADAGYFSEEQVSDERIKDVDLYIAPDRQKHGQADDVKGELVQPADATVIDQMRHKINTPEGRAVYRWRKAIVEPVFGQIKDARGFRRFMFRGKVQVQAEWLFICVTHNLLKLYRAGACRKAA
jgi:IS5 family transposase